ncbi:MAG: VCBS repeat-containing protein [Planctomycetota bacterium]
MIDSDRRAPFSIAIGDIDGDGDLDIAASGNLPGLVWYESDGAPDPTFTRRSQEVAVGFTTRSYNLADIDGDDRLDIVATAGATPTVLTLYRNNGDSPPTFDEVTIDDFGDDNSQTVQARDMDADGDVDLVVVRNPMTDLSQLHLYTNDGAGAFTQRVIATDDRRYVYLHLADLDDDGRMDVIANGSWIKQQADGSFMTFTFEPEAWRPSETADLDGDGDLDVISPGPEGDLRWYESSFSISPVFTFPSRRIDGGDGAIERLLAADVDADGDMDILAAGEAELRLVENLGTCPVVNIDRQTCHATAALAVQQADPGDAIIVSGVVPNAGLVDFQGKALSVFSDRDFVLPPLSSWWVGDGSELIAGDAAGFAANGILTIDSSAHVTIAATDGVDIDALPELGPGAMLDIVGDLRVRQSPTFISKSISETDTLVAIGDADADGDDDLITRGASGTGYLWRAATDGTFSAEPLDVLVTWGAAIGDLNGDGKPDIVAGAQLPGDVPPRTIAILLGDGQGGFSRIDVVLGVASGGEDIAIPIIDRIVDLDADGDSDIVCRVSLVIDGVLSGAFATWLENVNPGATEFTPHIISTKSAQILFPPDLEVQDIDSDGDLDLLAGEDRRLNLYRSNGASPPQFERVEIGGPSTDYGAVVAADLDRDDDVDVAVITSGGLVWYEQDGGGQFTPRSIAVPDLSSTGVTASSIAAADVDRDGDLDLLTELIWLESDGASPPGFTIRPIAERTGQGQADVRDINGDGLVDVLTRTPVQLFLQRNQTSIEVTAVGEEMGGALGVAGDVLLTRGGIRLDQHSHVHVLGQVRIDTPVASIEGDGLVTAMRINNGGVVEPAPGPSALLFDADFSQTVMDAAAGPRSGVISMTLTDGALPRLEVTGDTTLAGTLRVGAEPDFDPPVGATIPIISAGALEGRFDVALLPAFSDRFLTVVYDDGNGPGRERTSAAVFLQVNALDEDLLFDPSAEADAAGVPTDATLSDVNGDDFVDLVITVRDTQNPLTSPGAILVFYNAGNGGAGEWLGFENVDAVQQITAGVNPDAVFVADVDGDGAADFVVANRGTPGSPEDDTAALLFNDAAAGEAFSLRETQALRVGDEPRDVIVLDIDGDDALDIVVVNSRSDSVSVFFNDGPNAEIGDPWLFDEQEIEPPGLPDDECVPLSIRPGDVNGNLYFALANSGTDSVTVIGVDGRSLSVDGEFAVDARPQEVRFDDLDLDGLPEIITVNLVGESLSILRNTSSQSDLTFAPVANIELNTSVAPPRDIALGDFDDDASGDLDILVLADNAVRVFRNDSSAGQITLSPLPDEPAAANPLLLVAGDLNADQRDDYVTVGTSTLSARSLGAAVSGSGIGAFLGVAPPEPCIGDIDGDGRSGLADFAQLARNFGATGLPSGAGQSFGLGDIDDDGDIDMDDFNVLAANFGCVGVSRRPR